MVKVRVPVALRDVNIPSIFELKATTLGQVIDELNKLVPGIKKELCNESGAILSSAYDFFVNGESTHPSRSSTPVKDGDDIIIVPLEIDVGG